MIETFKEKSIQKKYDKLIVNGVNKDQNTTKINKVVVLLDNESLENIVISNLINTLPFKKENIEVFIYKEYSKKEELASNFFTNNEFGFKASLKSDNLKNFVKNDYDLLINYVKTPNLYTNTITLLSQASLKASFAGIDDRLYDLVISDEGLNEAVLNQELKKYLTILKKI
ncbi:DUF6913 domain-containing protein [Tenacibaculum salmonis]|uniref:DUF6913 domain-containing protein n=1 Tax=Tenacibaculum sp. P3-BQ1 TaxID=3232310 RepID=UPI0034DE16E1